MLIDSPRGKEELVAECKRYAEVVDTLSSDIKLIIPTVDETLPFFAKSRPYFNSLGIEVMVSNEYTISICRDKAEFFRFCRRHSFKTPSTMQDTLIAKPRFGKSSKGIIKLDRSYIVQPFIDAPEISIDYFADFEGNPLSIIPRYRKNIVNGESTEYELVKNQDLTEVTRLGNELKLIGHSVIQGFLIDKDICFTEVNPRFGGGSWLTFNMFSGVKWMISNVSKRKGDSLRSSVS